MTYHPMNMGGVPSIPTAGGEAVTNIYINESGAIEFEFSGGSTPTSFVLSTATSGNKPVTNLFVNNGKLVIEYEEV